MIFGEKFDKGEQIDTKPGKTDNYRDIKLVELSKIDAVNFWKSEISIPNAKEYSMPESELRERTRDCKENQFEFDYNQSADVKSILDKFSEWEDMKLGDRENICHELAKSIGEDLGIEVVPQVRFYDGDIGQYGYYNDQTNCVHINQNELNDPRETVRTIAHEMRHVYQHFRAEKMETEQDELYKYNFEHYIPVAHDEYGYAVNFLDYQGQMIEAEARAFENLFEV